MIACRLGLTSPFAIPEAKISAESAIAGSGSQSSQSGAAWPSAQAAITARPWKRRVRKRNEIDVADQRADAERGDQQADDPRVVAEAGQHEHRHRDEERRPGRVADREGRPPDAQQPVLLDEAEAGAEAAVLVLLRQRRPVRHEAGDEHDRDEVGGGVDQQHRGGADEADQEPGRAPGPASSVARVAAWNSACASVICSSSSPSSSGTITFCAAK